MKQLLLIPLCWWCFAAFGQDLKTDIRTMNERLASLDSYRIVVDYSAGDTSDFFDSGTASVLVTDLGMFYETEFAEMMINNQHTIIVNEEEKTLIWSENTAPNKNESIDLNRHILNGVDTLMQSADSIYSITNGAERTYFLRFTHSYFDMVELTFSGAYLVRSVYYYSREAAGDEGVTAVSNVHIDENPAYDKLLLTSGFYLDSRSGNMRPGTSFADYVLIHNTSVESYTE